MSTTTILILCAVYASIFLRMPFRMPSLRRIKAHVTAENKYYRQQLNETEEKRIQRMREGKASSEKAKAERIASGEMLVVSPDKELGRRFQPPFLGDDSGFREWSRKEAQPILDQHPANINMPALLLADTRNTCMAAYLKYDDDRLYERAVEAENLIKERARMAATTKKQAKQAEAYVATIIATVAVAPAIALASMYGKKVR